MATDSGPAPRLILASASPRRRELLQRFALDFDVQPAAIDESARALEQAADYVVRMAQEKALAVAARWPQRAVLAADTSVVLEGVILGKPRDKVDARVMLESLSDQVHQVMTAVTLITPDQVHQVMTTLTLTTPDLNPDLETHTRLSCTDVQFGPLDRAWIDAYIASGDPMDKAGAYGIQNAAGLMVRRIEGSYSGVVGLPLYETRDLLAAAGLLARL